MKYIILIICSIITPVFCFEKICANCKFFKKDIITGNTFGKCLLFPKTEEKIIEYLVTGIQKNVDYYYCSTARNSDNMCGKKGIKYEDKRKNKK